MTAIHKAHKNAIRTVWHPDPRHDLIHTDHGNIRVLTGPMKGQLKTAAFIEL